MWFWLLVLTRNTDLSEITALYCCALLWFYLFNLCLGYSLLVYKIMGDSTNSEFGEVWELLFIFLFLPLVCEGASSVPAFFSEDDSQSNDSSDSDSSSSQSDDADQETYLLDEPLERTTGSAHANSAAQAPRSMQWAVRTTPSQRTAGGAPTSSSTPAGKPSLHSFSFQRSLYEVMKPIVSSVWWVSASRWTSSG